jgi:hypothetical protein
MYLNHLQRLFPILEAVAVAVAVAVDCKNNLRP